MKSIYLDNAATTKVDENVAKVMNEYMLDNYGNASSTHHKGQEAKRAIEEARHVIAKSINARDDEIFFTSGGTEANNWVLKGLFFHPENKKKHIVTTKIEHDCIIKTCEWLKTRGCKITYVDVDSEGFVDMKKLEEAVTPETLVVSVIHGNNEIGTIQNLEEIGKICRKKNVYFHTDACQSYTKTKLNVNRQNLDFVTLNAHKIHGPKGVGALYIRKGVKISPLINGGGQEKGMRSGTENVPGIVGFARAVKNSSFINLWKMNKVRNRLINEILKIPKTRLNGAAGKKRLCNNINISFSDIEGEAIGGYLDAYGICTSTGSACSSNTLEKSHVLKAIGLNELQINSSVRISISKYTTNEEADYFLKKLNDTVVKLRKMSPLAL